jgi:hypothetical protein
MLGQRTSINLLVLILKRETQLLAARFALVVASHDRAVTLCPFRSDLAAASAVAVREGGLCRVTVRERTGRSVPHHRILVLECLFERFHGAAIPCIEQTLCGQPTDLDIIVRQELDQGEDG